MDQHIQQLLWNNINIFTNRLPAPGVLMVCGNGQGRENLITLGWMTFGVAWGEPVVTVMVRKSRFSYELLQQNPQFTLNAMPRGYEDALRICGSKSGRYADKFAETGLKKNSPSIVNVPTLRDALISMECQIVNRQPMSSQGLSDLINAKWYKDGDYHEYMTAVIRKFDVNLKG